MCFEQVFSRRREGGSTLQPVRQLLCLFDNSTTGLPWDRSQVNSVNHWDIVKVTAARVSHACRPGDWWSGYCQGVYCQGVCSQANRQNQRLQKGDQQKLSEKTVFMQVDLLVETMSCGGQKAGGSVSGTKGCRAAACLPLTSGCGPRA